MSLATILGPIIARKVIEVIGDKIADKRAAPQIAEAVLEEIKVDPVLKNEMNEEAPYQSRVGVGGVTGLVGALGVLVPIAAKWLGYDIEPARVVTILFALLTVWGHIYSLYGRFKSGLAPLFSRFR